MSRITRLLQVAVIGRILASPQTTVPFDSVLAGQGLILLRLSAEWLPREECDLLGALFLSVLTDRLFARSVQGAGAPRLARLRRRVPSASRCRRWERCSPGWRICWPRGG